MKDVAIAGREEIGGQCCCSHGHEHATDTVQKSGRLREYLRLGIGAALFALSLIFELPGYAGIAAFAAAYLVIGGDVLLRAARNIIRGKVFDENFLMAVATLGAFAIGEYPEAAAVMLFYQVGERFQERALDSSQRSIAALMDIRPDFANVVDIGGVRRVSPEAVLVGDILRVLPGEKIPLDGELVRGETMLDVSALTGESAPVELAAGDTALSGSVNLSGVIELKVIKPYGESTVSKILEMVKNASHRKARTEKFISRFARVYTPAVVGASALLAAVPPLFFGAEFSGSLYNALVFLVASCPCALVISIPLGFFGGIGACSRRGILVKGGNFLEAACKLDTVVFDKTGTLTRGRFEVEEIEAADDASKARALALAAAAEQYSTHPAAKAIVEKYVMENGLSPEKAENVTELAGRGVMADVGGAKVLVGNARLMAENGIEAKAREYVGTVMFVAADGELLAGIYAGDALKPSSAGAIKRLKELGVAHVAMLTGDRRAAAEDMAGKLGIEDVRAELLPGGKLEALEDIMARAGGTVAFAGDGINDAPVLARADLGFAMGALGSDAAIEAADIVIMNDEPESIATTVVLARRTLAIVYQNIVFALAVKGAVLLLGAFGIASMWGAVFSDVGVAFLAILNALRILRGGERT